MAGTSAGTGSRACSSLRACIVALRRDCVRLNCNRTSTRVDRRANPPFCEKPCRMRTWWWSCTERACRRMLARNGVVVLFRWSFFFFFFFFYFRRWAEIHSAEIPRGSTCLLIQAGTHTFLSLCPSLSHTHTHTLKVHARPVQASDGGGVRCRAGAPTRAEGSLFPLSWTLLPSDDGPIVRASSGPAPFSPADKALFHKNPKQGGVGVWEGRGERRGGGEGGIDGSVERQRR